MPVMTRAPLSIGARLGAVLDSAHGDDPVTVVLPGADAARRLGAEVERRRAPGGPLPTAVAGIGVGDLVARVAQGPLTDAGLGVAGAGADAAALRAEARAWGGWAARLAGSRAGLGELHRAVAELRRCPPAVVEALARRPGRTGELARLALAVGARLGAGGLADPLAVTVAAQEALAGGAVPDLGRLVVLDAGSPPPATRRLVEALVSRSPGPGPALTGSPRPTVTEVRICADPSEEARAAARAVVLSLERGVAPGRQAVLHPPAPAYGRALAAELARTGIPVAAPELRRLDRCAAGRGVLGLLGLAADAAWSRAGVAAWLAAAPVAVSPGGPPAPAARWEALAGRAGVAGGAVQWHQRLGRWADEARRRGDEEEAAAATALSRFVDGLVRASAPPRETTWSAHAAWVLTLFERYVDPGSGHGPGTAPWPDPERDGAARVRAALAGLAGLDPVAGPADVAGVLLVLGHVLSTTPWEGCGADGAGGGAVTVAPVGWARGMAFEDVVVVGTDDTTLARVDGDGLLPEEARRVDVSGGLRTRAARRAEILDDVAAALADAGGRRTATCPRTDPRTGAGDRPTRHLRAWTDTGTRWRTVASFADALAQRAPTRSRPELELQAMARWVDQGHDLAHWPPLVVPGGRPRGRLARGIEAVRARHGDAFTRFDGAVGAGALSPFAPGVEVSPTRLETLARCPRRYLLDRALGVAAPETVTGSWRMAPARRGSLVHAVLEDYLLARLEGAPRSPELLGRLAHARLEEAEQAGAVGPALVWALEKAAVRRELERFQAEEGEGTPLAAELAFGGGGEHAGPAVPVVLGPGRVLHFHGRADRVERAPSGGLVVSDYKTGRQYGLSAMRRDPVAGGRLLQLPVYALAARERFGGDGPVTARYWLLSDRRVAPSFELTLTPDVQARFVEVLDALAGVIEAGTFPGAPSDRPEDRQFTACRHCDLDRLCPADRQLSWARKRGAPQLAALRSLAGAAVPAEEGEDPEPDGAGAGPPTAGGDDAVAVVLASFAGATVAPPPAGAGDHRPSGDLGPC